MFSTQAMQSRLTQHCQDTQAQPFDYKLRNVDATKSQCKRGLKEVGKFAGRTVLNATWNAYKLFMNVTGLPGGVIGGAIGAGAGAGIGGLCKLASMVRGKPAKSISSYAIQGLKMGYDAGSIASRVATIVARPAHLAGALIGGAALGATLTALNSHVVYSQARDMNDGYSAAADAVNLGINNLNTPFEKLHSYIHGLGEPKNANHFQPSGVYSV